MAWQNGNSLSSVEEWTAYTPTLTAWTAQNTVGTAPTTGGSFNALYYVVDKILYMNFNFAQITAGTAGSGVYVASIPSAYTIDTSVTGVISNYSTAIYNYDTMLVPGFGQGFTSNGLVTYQCKVLVASDQYFCIFSNSFYISDQYLSFAETDKMTYLHMEFPIV